MVQFGRGERQVAPPPPKLRLRRYLLATVIRRLFQRHVDLELLHFRQVHVRVVPIGVAEPAAVVQVLATVLVNGLRAVALVLPAVPSTRRLGRRLNRFVFRHHRVPVGARRLQQAVQCLLHHLPLLEHATVGDGHAVGDGCAVGDGPAVDDRGGPGARDIAVPSVLRQLRLLVGPPVRQARVQYEHHARRYGQSAQDKSVDHQVSGHAVHGRHHQATDGYEQCRADDQQKRFL